MARPRVPPQRAAATRARGAGQGVSGGSAGANAQAHTPPTRARAGGRAGGRAARARRTRMGRRGAAVFGCSLRAHHSPESASSSTREPAPRQRPPERMRDRDFDREPDEPGVCGLDGSGRAGERSGVRQLMGDGVPMLLLRDLRAPASWCRSVRCRAKERVLTRGQAGSPSARARPHLPKAHTTVSFGSTCVRGRVIILLCRSVALATAAACGVHPFGGAVGLFNNKLLSQTK